MSSHDRAPAAGSMEISVDYLADLMFRNNPNDLKLGLILPELDNPKDLFMFLLDLFCKGMVLLYGEIETNSQSQTRQMRIEIDKLSQEQVLYIKKKMANAGVHLNIQICSRPPERAVGSTNLRTLLDQTSDTLDLPSYCLSIASSQYEYKISFELIRLTPP